MEQVDREYIKCSSDYCCRFNPGTIKIASHRIIEPDADCKNCNCNQGEVNLYYEAV